MTEAFGNWAYVRASRKVSLCISNNRTLTELRRAMRNWTSNLFIASLHNSRSTKDLAGPLLAAASSDTVTIQRRVGN